MIIAVQIQRARRFLGRFQRIVADLYSVLLPLSVMVLLSGNVLLLWVAVFRDIDPVTSQRIVSVNPPDRYLDRERVREFKVTREICASRAQQVEVLRAWTEARGGDQVRPVVVFTSLFYELSKGCHLVDAVQTIPETLPPAQYIYAVSLRACNALNQCQNRYLDLIPVTVVGGMWRNLDIPLPPPMQPGQPLATSPGPPRGFTTR